MLRVDLSALKEGSIETVGVVAVDDPVLADLDFSLAEPIDVRGRLLESGAGRYYWRGMLRTVVASACRRCLAPVPSPVVADVNVLFTDDPTTDDPSAYGLPLHATELDLRDMVREELILAVPAYPLCRNDCRGLCPQCGQNLNEGPCACAPAPDPRWAALRVLVERPDDER